MEHQFVLIGSGTSTGVPIPGCECVVCTSPDPRNFRNRTAAYIQLESGQTILVDATTDLRHQCLKHNVRRVDSVIYTHAHADHICGTDDLRVFNFQSKRHLDCYGTHTTLNGIRSMFPYIFKQDPTYVGGLTPRLNLHEISNEESFSIGESTFHPFPLPHGGVSVTGFRIGNLGYATDCKGLSPRAAEILHGVEYLFLDGLRWEQHNSHNTIDEAIEIAASLKAKQTYLIHLSHGVEHEEVSRKLPLGVALGYDGLMVRFNEG